MLKWCIISLLGINLSFNVQFLLAKCVSHKFKIVIARNKVEHAKSANVRRVAGPTTRDNLFLFYL